MKPIDKKTISDLAKKLRNVGPKLAERLLSVGIDSPEKLRRIGAKRAFEMIYAEGDTYGDYNAAYLYALEGAIQDCDWLEIDDSLKSSYKNYAQELQSTKRLKKLNCQQGGGINSGSRRSPA
jgi:DNA transformation protein